MSMSKVLRQMPAQAGRAGVARGEAARDPTSDEASDNLISTDSVKTPMVQAHRQRLVFQIRQQVV